MLKKSLVKLLLHKPQQAIAKTEISFSSEFVILEIDDTLQKQKELYTKFQNYEKVLKRQRTKK